MATDQKQQKSQEDDITYHQMYILAVLLPISVLFITHFSKF